jgi:peptide deformylase
MTVLKVLTEPDPILRAKSNPVDCVDKNIAKLMDDMFDTMIAYDGIGLAANQVGIKKRVVVVNIPEGMSVKIDENNEQVNQKSLVLKMANPEIIWHSEDMVDCNEGCLSVPDQRALVSRPYKIKLKFLDEFNNPQEMEMCDLHSICVQHEIDHLDGKLFIDYLPKIKRDIIYRKLKKIKRDERDS